VIGRWEDREWIVLCTRDPRVGDDQRSPVGVEIDPADPCVLTFRQIRWTSTSGRTDHAGPFRATTFHDWGMPPLTLHAYQILGIEPHSHLGTMLLLNGGTRTHVWNDYDAVIEPWRAALAGWARRG
jgi:hypothetical protein